MSKWPKAKLQEIVTRAKGARYTDVECISEEAARRLRFALYKFMADKPEYRITVAERVVRLTPIVNQIKEIRNVH